MRRVIAVLLAVVVAVWAIRAAGSRTICDRVRGDLMPLETAIELYRTVHGAPPPEDGLFETLKRENYIDHSAREADPWGNEYFYRPTPTGYDLRSLGLDGVFGTADDQTREDRWKWSTCTDPPSFFGCG